MIDKQKSLEDTLTALQGGSDAELLAALDGLARAVSRLADVLRPPADSKSSDAI